MSHGCLSHTLHNQQGAPVKIKCTSRWINQNQLWHWASLLHNLVPTFSTPADWLHGRMMALNAAPPWRPKCIFELKEDPGCLSTKETGLSSFTLTAPKQLASVHGWCQCKGRLFGFKMFLHKHRDKRGSLKMIFLSIFVQKAMQKNIDLNTQKQSLSHVRIQTKQQLTRRHTFTFTHAVMAHGMRPHLIKAVLCAQIPVVAGSSPQTPPSKPCDWESKERHKERRRNECEEDESVQKLNKPDRWDAGFNYH